MKFKTNVARKAACCALAAAMATMALPASAFADATEEDAPGDYLKEVAVAYGDSGADDLAAAGYDVIESDEGGAADVNAGNGKATYIGYKSTDDASKAITDLAVMNMKGNYNISAWKDELKENTNAATAKSYEFAPVIKELRANYKAGTNDITSVIDLLNTYTEDDSGLKMGDFLLDTSKCTADTLANVMLQSNPTNFAAVEYLLSKAVATDWTASIPKLAIDDTYDVDEDVLDALVDQVLDLRDDLVAYQESQKDLGDLEASVKEADTQSEATEVAKILRYGSIYEVLKGIEYGDSGKTLLDLFLTSKKFLSSDMLAPLASLLTEGQATLMSVVGIDTLILDSVDLGTEAQATTFSTAQTANDAMLKGADVKSISMYEGVNRAIFTEENVALTTDVVRTRAVTGDTSIFFNNVISDVLYGVAAVATALSVGSLVFLIRNYNYLKAVYAPTIIDGEEIILIADEELEADAALWRTAVSRSKAEFGILAAITAIIAGTAIAIDLYNYYHKKTRYIIPDIIVDKVDYTDEYGEEDTFYVDYEVARQTDGTAADMNGGSGAWNCLYYTTSKKAGDPVTVADLIVQTSSTSKNKNLSAVHAFSETAAVNLNGGDDASYLFFARDANAFSSATASAFGAGYLALAAGIALIIGLAGGFAIGRRKKGAVAA